MIIITVSVYLLYSCSFTVEVSPQEESYFFLMLKSNQLISYIKKQEQNKSELDIFQY